ncbi:MAG: invasion associated locus B family protein [Alphaproteobacteria bacterium]
MAILVALSLVVGLGAGAIAAESKVLGTHRDWEAYQLVEKGKKTCYMASQPIKTVGKYKKRGDVVVFVTHRPADKERDIINFHAGYKYKLDSTVEVAIGRRKFKLFTKGDTAWALTAADEQAMVKSMIKGNRMTVRGTSQRGTRTTDTYSLRGFSRIYRRINKACGIK